MRWSVARKLVARTSRRSRRAAASCSRSKSAIRVHSATNGGRGSCACRPPRRSTAPTTGTASRARSIWRARVARLSRRGDSLSVTRAIVPGRGAARQGGPRRPAGARRAARRGRRRRIRPGVRGRSHLAHASTCTFNPIRCRVCMVGFLHMGGREIEPGRRRAAVAYPRKDRREQRITGVLSAVFLSIVGGAAVLYLLLRLLPSGGPNLPGAPPPPRPAEILSPPTPTPAPGVPVAQPTPSAAPTPIGPRPAVDDFAQRWVQAFQARRYADLYEMLSKKAKASIPRDKFVGRYDQVFGGVNVVEIKATLPPVRDPPPTVASVDARFDAHFRTGRYGEWDEHYTIPFVYEDNAWKVDWTPDLIFKDLAPDRSVRVFDDDPTRGNIVDKNGVPLAQQQRVPALGVIPGQLKDKAGTINALAQYLQIDPKVIQQ